MGILSSFTFISLDGYYKGQNEDTTWHSHGEVELDFLEESFRSGDVFLFGRVTYELMAGFWPTPQAYKVFTSAIAKGMNQATKLVISKTLSTTSWANSRLLDENWQGELAELKKTTNIHLLGSGSILSQLADAGMIDLFKILVDPVAIGRGTPIFKGITNQLNLKLVASDSFKDGVNVLQYEMDQG